MAVRTRRPVVETLESRITLTASVGPAMHEALWEQVIVAFREDVQNPRAAAESVINPTGGRLGHVYEHSIGGFSAQLPVAAVRGLVHHPLISKVEIDMLMSTHGQVIPTGVSRINGHVATVGGRIGEGKSIDVGIAIIDSGIDPHHPDLNVVGGSRFYTVTSGPPRNRGSVQDNNFNDDNGHGTHVAGTVAAKDNGSGVVGVAPGAPLWAVKVLDASGNGFMSDIIAGIDWVTAQADKIAVANMSLGGTGRSDLLRAAIQRSVDAGILYTVSAGNNWGDIHGLSKTFNTTDDVIPAAYPEVATIAALADSDGKPGGLGPATSWGQYGRDDAWWGPSNFSNSYELKNQHFMDANPVYSPGLGIDLILPGADILSTYRNGGYATMSGTSMAAPHAAGLAALHIAAHGRANNASEVHTIRQALIDHAPAWNAPEGLAVHWGPAAWMANVGWAGEISPSQDPTVSIGSPADAAVVWGDVVVTASAAAADGASLDSVVVLLGANTYPMHLDGDLWTFTWTTDAIADSGEPLYADGTYQLTVTVTDSTGRSASDSVTVTVANVDAQPTLDIISPVTGATLSGTVEVMIKAYDDRGIASVEVFLGDESLGQAVPAGGTAWTLAVNTAGVGDGNYALRAVATDSGDQTAEATVAVIINNTVLAANVALLGSAFQVNRNFWRAQVTATVSDNSSVTLAGAEVIGRWSYSSNLLSLYTNSQGKVLFESENLRSTDSVDFTVVDVRVAGYQYEGPDTIRVFHNGSTQALLTLSRNEDEAVAGSSPVGLGASDNVITKPQKAAALSSGVQASAAAAIATPPVGPPPALSAGALDEFFLTADF